MGVGHVDRARRELSTTVYNSMLTLYHIIHVHHESHSKVSRIVDSR